MTMQLMAVYKKVSVEPVVSFIVYKNEGSNYPYEIKVEYDSFGCSKTIDAYEFSSYKSAIAQCSKLMAWSAADLMVMFGMYVKDKDPLTFAGRTYYKALEEK